MKGAILVFGLGLMLLAAVATAWVATTRPSADYTHTVNTVSRAARRLPTHTNSGTGTGTGAGAGAAVRLFNRRHESPVEDDGYSYTNSRKMSWLRRTIANLMDRKKPGTLILIRHGETLLNSNKTFTGWMDPDLSEDGVIEIEHAARLMLERGYDVDMVYTSRLKRAIRSAWILIIGLNQVYKPVYKSWRLNERMYGAMEGLSKPQMAAELGEEVVQGFRRGLYDRPPPMTPDHPHWHKNERKYSDLAPYEIPITESLQDTLDRTVPLWKKRILPALASGRNVCIVAHANSLRGIVKIIENIPPEDIPSVVIPNGIPLVYKFDKKMKPVPQANAVAPLRGEFLEKKGLLRDALKKEKEWVNNVPGFNGYKLRDASRLSELPLSVMELKLAMESYGILNENSSMPVIRSKTLMDPVLQSLSRLSEEREYISQFERAAELNMSTVNNLVSFNQVPESSLTNKTVSRDSTGPVIYRRDSVWKQHKGNTSDKKDKASNEETGLPEILVIIRHGKTEYNKLGIFTGWEDAPLSEDGRKEARNAGKILKLHGIEFDVVYTSWLSRAIETAWLILNELDCLWLPILKTWRLNERMYGALTGMSKSMIKERHGEEQFKKWRRGYGSRPPKISSFSSMYPGNDDRYRKNVNDIRYSLFESLIRSISHKKIELHRKFPKTESLRDCMKRTIPYFTDVVMPNSVEKGKTVLISSSENAIRGLLMYLCEIPEDLIHQVEIPTGLPLIFNFRKKCIQILDDGVERDNPLELYEKHNFGAAPEILFRPCDSDDDSCAVFIDKNNEIKSFSYDPIIRLNSMQKGQE